MKPMSSSKKVMNELELELPRDIREVLDGRISSEDFVGEFDRVVEMEKLLDGSVELLRPGMMPPDFFPILSNNYGDFLCVRIGLDSQVSEICQWYHGGGDWIPYGNSLAEAILYDSMRSAWMINDNQSMLPYALASWISEHLQTDPRELESLWNLFSSGEIHDALKMMLSCGWSFEVVHRDLVEFALSSPLRLSRDSMLLQLAGPNELQRWRFDADLVPEDLRGRVSHILQKPIHEWSAQSWPLADELARRVLHHRTDLAWPWHIVGWALMKRGENEQALSTFHEGLQASVFTDQAVTMRTHWFDSAYGKFSAAQIAELDSFGDRGNDYLRMLLATDSAKTATERVSDYWNNQAHHCEPSQITNLYRYWYSAGWDLGCVRWQRFPEIFTGLIQATKSSAPSLFRLISLHRKSLLNCNHLRHQTS